MNNIKSIIFLLCISFSAYAQNIDFDIINSHSKSIVKENLIQIETLEDFYPEFPSSWIKSYASVKITIVDKEKELTSTGLDFKLNDDQKSLLNSANHGSIMLVDVAYYPNYNSQNKELKKIHKEFTIIPYSQAEFTGGYDLLKKYIKESAIDKIPESIASTLEMVSINFIVNKEGKVSNIKITQSSGDKDLDNLLNDSLAKMPEWIPAKNANDLNVEQEFILRIGNLIGC